MVASNFDEVGVRRRAQTARRQWVIVTDERRLGRLRFDLVRSGRARSVDRVSSRLHGFRDLAHQVDDQKTVLETGALDLDMVADRDLALERPSVNPAMQDGLLFPLGL